MQNQGPPYQGPVNHGAFSDHTYNNQMGRHCAPNNNYQPYVNGPYSVGNPRAHHYGGHQMQQGPPPNHQQQQHPYRGNYAPPPPPQYGNQDMYRNHHSMYVGGNNRNMHTKTVWNENNTSDMMPYNHGAPRPQMMNNSTPRNASSMRSPPHLASVPSPGTQHYRQMQSPGHSPQTWPQVQAQSPGMHPVARTTPSPLQSHARSPGHSQPYSPSGTHMPASVNMQPSHQMSTALPETPQPAQLINQGMNSVLPTGPLHSLQKMVMLEPNANDPMQLPNESSCEQLPVCATNPVAADEEMKDSSYATYYNLDENRLESRPHSTPTYSKPIEYSTDTSAGEMSHSPQDMPSSTPPQNQHISHFTLSSSDVKSVSLHSSKNPELSNGPSVSADVAEIQVPLVSETILQQENNSSSRTSDVLIAAVQSPVQSSFVGVPFEKPVVSQETMKSEVGHNEYCNSIEQPVVRSDSSNESKFVKDNEGQPLDCEAVEKLLINPPKIKLECNFNNESVCHSVSSTVAETDVECDKAFVNSDVSKSKMNAISEERTLKTSVANTDIRLISNSTVSLGNTRVSTSDIARNPVKVVIHRIRTNDTNDMWHVPNSNGSSVITVHKTPNLVSKRNNSPARTLNSKTGPQIVKLAPVMSKVKNPLDSNDVKPVVSDSVTSDKEVKNSPNNVYSDNSIDPSATSSNFPNPSRRKRLPKNPPVKKAVGETKKGRPVGSTKAKSSPLKKKKAKGKQKNAKKRPLELEETQVIPKQKKAKPFNGPYLRVEGSKDNPSSITVVNVAIKEEEKGKIVRTKASESSMVKRPRVGHTSTLSPHYDAFNKDRTWMCIFCHKGSHSGGLGDLYGPYYVQDADQTSHSSEDFCGPMSRGARSKRRKSDGSVAELVKTPVSQRKTPKAVKCVEQMDTPVSVNSILQQSNESPPSEIQVREVWIHEDCAVWCQSVSLMGSQIHGLEEAIQESHENMCSCCKLNGATLGCWCKGCSEQYHFCCAKEKGCKLDIENFSLFCPKHKDSRSRGQKKTATLSTPENL